MTSAHCCQIRKRAKFLFKSSKIPKVSQIQPHQKPQICCPSNSGQMLFTSLWLYTLRKNHKMHLTYSNIFQPSDKLHPAMVMQHGDITMTYFECYVNRILYLGRGLSLNFLCPLALFTDTNSPFGATIVPNSMTYTKKSVFNYNNVSKCRVSICPYKHACQSCGDSGHPRIKCSKTVAPNTPNMVPT